MPGVKKVALPKQGGAFADQVVGGVGRHLVVGHLQALRLGPACFAVPDSLVLLALGFPLEHGGLGRSNCLLSCLAA